MRAQGIKCSVYKKNRIVWILNETIEVPRYKFLEGTGTYIEGNLFTSWIEVTEILKFWTVKEETYIEGLLYLNENLQRNLAKSYAKYRVTCL